MTNDAFLAWTQVILWFQCVMKSAWGRLRTVTPTVTKTVTSFSLNVQDRIILSPTGGDATWHILNRQGSGGGNQNCNGVTRSGRLRLPTLTGHDRHVSFAGHRPRSKIPRANLSSNVHNSLEKLVLQYGFKNK